MGFQRTNGRCSEFVVIIVWFVLLDLLRRKNYIAAAGIRTLKTAGGDQKVSDHNPSTTVVVVSAFRHARKA